jgi:small subunit ribosomal protein S8
VVEVPASGLKKDITRILYDKGYILSWKVEDDGKQGIIKIALKYDRASRQSAIKELTRVSSPGLRQYAHSGELPRVLNGLGVAIISTSRGVITDKEARTLGVGGEVICYVS